MPNPPEKHIPYHTVLEGLRGAAECPFCALEAEGQTRYLDALLYESVNDPDVRAALRKSRGCCVRHARLLVERRDAFAAAILLADQVQGLMEFLADLEARPPRRTRPAAAALWESHALCPACRNQWQERERHAQVLIDWLSDDEMRAAFEAAPALCVPHFLHLLDKTRVEKARLFLLDTQRQKCAGVLDELREFIRKHDYRFTQEGFGKEGDSWLRAAAILSGKKEVF